jgi:hypothetical protein
MATYKSFVTVVTASGHDNARPFILIFEITDIPPVPMLESVRNAVLMENEMHYFLFRCGQLLLL